MFFSVITKNLNREILTNNLVAFKRWYGVRIKNFNIIGVHLKIRFLGDGVTKNLHIYIYIYIYIYKARRNNHYEACSTRKRNKRLQHTGNLSRKNLHLKNIC